MTLLPSDERRPMYMVMGMLVFSTIVSFAYTFVLEPVNPIAHEDDWAIAVWRWLTTALLSLLAIGAKYAIKHLKKEFVAIRDGIRGVVDEMEQMKQAQLNFAMGLTDVLIDLNPEKAVMIHKKMNGLIKQRARAATAGSEYDGR